ncbi:MAG: hypothetical protein VX498_06240 [Myxococcota bacterium]|nr:hypothetical protein [Myxococcota bacterium]
MSALRRFTQVVTLFVAMFCGLAWAGAAGLPPVPDTPPAVAELRMPDRFLLVSGQVAIGEHFDPFIKQVYARNSLYSFGLRGTVLFGERIGFGFGGEFQNREGTGVAPSDQEVPTVMIWQIPVYVEVHLRMLLWKTQLAVPYLRAGVDGVVWWENFFVDGLKYEVRGLKWGAHIAGGVQFRLPFPEINQPGRLIGDPVLDDIYLHVEGWARSADNFGTSPLDLSSAGAAVGITLLM